MGNVGRLLDKFGFGWIISSTEEFVRISLSDLRPIPFMETSTPVLLWANTVDQKVRIEKEPGWGIFCIDSSTKKIVKLV